MGRRWIIFWGVLGVAAALAAVLLPFTQCVRGHREQEQTAAELKMQLDALTRREVEKQWNLARWYNLNLTMESPDPGFRAAYDGIWDLGQGRMGLLEVPEWNLKLPITHGIGGKAGHDPATPLPMAGQETRTVIWLNAEYPWAEHMGVYIDTPGARRCFRVLSVQVMPIGWSTEVPAGQEVLILAYDHGNLRTIVRCVPCEEKMTERQQTKDTLRRALIWASTTFFTVPLLSARRFWKKNIQLRGVRWQVLKR